jgi:hypothetical protein
MCLAKEGDIVAGISHAQRVLADLAPRDDNRPVVDLAVRVSEVIPFESRGRPEVVEYRRLVTARSADRRRTSDST